MVVAIYVCYQYLSVCLCGDKGLLVILSLVENTDTCRLNIAFVSSRQEAKKLVEVVIVNRDGELELELEERNTERGKKAWGKGAIDDVIWICLGLMMMGRRVLRMRQR